MRNSFAAPSLLLLLILSASLNLCFCMRFSALLAQCSPSSYLHGSSGNCNGSDCCRGGESYAQYHCSPPVTDQTPAKMTVNSFARGGDGGGASECESRFYSDDEKVVALSTGWYNRGSRCLKNIKIHANGKSVLARVVDECDSVNGCDNGHGNQPPCRNNIVDASPAVWRELGISMDVGEYHIIWSEA